MSITPGGNPVCPQCGRWSCSCRCPDEQRIVALTLHAIGIAEDRLTALDIAGQILNALNLAGYQVVFAE